MSQWRNDHPSAGVITLFLAKSSATADKVRALKAGADDYLRKPIDALELAARVDSSLRRRDREVAASPTTRLPGAYAIEREVAGRLEAGEGFLLCYFDLDNFKAFNDVYGYAKADAVIGQTGDIFREVVSRFGSSRDFIGHVAGDDFVCVFTEASGERLCRKIVQSFDKIIPLYYDLADRRRGHIETDDRYGQRRKFPIISLSVAAIDVKPHSRTSYAILSAQIAEVKKQAKSISGSAFLLSVEGQPAEVRALVE
jgi:diguanylate cyclase (GGDEF)-like protein